jgi:hypothetical protein
LGVAHDALAVAGASAAEFASGNRWRFWGAGISAAGGHGVGEIQACGFDADQFFARAWNRVRDVADLQNFGTA